MSSLTIEMTGPNCAQIRFSSACCGDCLTAGEDTHHVINVMDGDFLRRTAGRLFKLRHMKHEHPVSLKIGDAPRLKFDKSLWHQLADALLALAINLDASPFLSEDERSE